MTQNLPSLELTLDHVLVQSDAPDALAAFYARALDMVPERLDERRWMCAAPGRRVLFGPGPTKQLGFAAFGCRSRPDLEALRRRIDEAGAKILPSPSPLFGNDAFAVRDPDDNVIAFGLSRPSAEAGAGTAPLPGRLQHVVVTTRDVERLLGFYRDILGFRLSDRVEDDDGRLTAFFMRSDAEHHSFAAFLAPERRLDHQSLETSGWMDIRDWADRLAERDIAIDWGPGRHGPGNNLFFMFRDPDGNWIEISAELEHLNPGYPVRVWPHNERTLNSWGRGVLRA